MSRKLVPKGRTLRGPGRTLRPAGRTLTAGARAKRPTNPLDDVPVTGNVETDDAADGKKILQVLRDSKAQLAAATSNGYWICLVFTGDQQRDEFVRLAGWEDLADSTDTYYDGVALAERMGLQLSPVRLRLYDTKPDKRLIREVGIIGRE